ncbi:MAG TPA: DUF892 family protein, partial [Chloroflexia bacterium]|nr:DUF892 family protein [Chloroflexia bacterium]
LIAAATEMGKQGVVALFEQNLKQEQATAQKIEESEPELLKRALATWSPAQGQAQTSAQA